MPSASPPLTLDPDRLLPTDAAVRPLARSLYEGVRELPIISPHGHVPAQWLAEDTPFTDPTSLLITPDHYVNRLLHAHGVELSELGVGRGPLDERDARAAFRPAVRELEDLPRDAGPFLARRPAPRHLRRAAAAERRDGGRHLRPGGGGARLAGLPAPGALRPLRYRGAGHHRRPLRRPGGARIPARRSHLDRPGRADLPPGPQPRAGVCGPGTPTPTDSPRSRASTPATTPASWPPSRTAAPTSKPTAPSPPTTAMPTPAPTSWPSTTPSSCTVWRARATSPSMRPPPCGGTSYRRWPGWPATTAW